MDIGGFRGERNSARILSFGFDNLGAGECICISQIGTTAVVCLDLTARISDWKEMLSRLTPAEGKMIWVALVSYKADEYNYEQLKLLKRLHAALESLGAHLVGLPQAHKARYYGFWNAELEEALEPTTSVVEFSPVFA